MSLLVFALLVFVLTVPVWVAGAVSGIMLLPDLPVAAFAVVVPSIAAAIVVGRTEGRSAVGALFRRVREVTVLPGWSWFAVLAVPTAFTVAAWMYRRLSGQSVEFVLPLFAVLPLLALTIGAAILEEVGWTAFATERLTGRFGLVGGALVLGLGWAIWHYPALVEAHHGIEWIVWWTAWTVAQRVAMVALYYLAGRNFAGPVLFHATSNLLWQAAPEAFEPMVEALVVTLIAVALSLVSARARSRPSPSHPPSAGK